MKNWTLRWQITLLSALFTGLAVTIFGVVAAYNLYAEQVEIIDGELRPNRARSWTTGPESVSSGWRTRIGLRRIRMMREWFSATLPDRVHRGR